MGGEGGIGRVPFSFAGIAAVFGVLLSAGCARKPRIDVENFVCETKADCPPGRICSDGLCVLSGGAGRDAATDYSGAGGSAGAEAGSNDAPLPSADSFVPDMSDDGASDVALFWADGAPGYGEAGTGGATGVGGGSATGGVVGSGGIPGAGGAGQIDTPSGAGETGGATVVSPGSGGLGGGTQGTGATSSFGGATSSGGIASSGGVVGSGGIASSGGVVGSGGIASSGGVVGSGGTPSTGGAVGSGGIPGTGGNPSTGGATGTGGTGGTTDSGLGGNGTGGGGSGGTSGGSTLPPITDYSALGPFATTTDTGTGPDGQCTAFRPATMGENGFLHAPIVFGPGIGMEPTVLQDMLLHFASHGFVVIETGVLNGGPNAPANRTAMLNALNWIVQQNSQPGKYQGKLHVNHAVAMGYSVGADAAVEIGGEAAVAAVVSIHGHTATAALHGTLFLTSGTADTVGLPLQQKTFDQSQVKTFMGTVIGANHGYITQDAGGVERPAIVAWLRYRIYNDTGATHYFSGDDCVLCTSPWTNPQRKNWP